jgi:hypothetical protein
MVRVGLQLTIWLPVVVVVVLTATDVCKLVRVFSVTDAAPLTIVGNPAEYPMVLAVKVSNPESRSVEIAVADHPRTRVIRRVSVTVTVSSCAVVAVTVSGDAKLPKFPRTGTLIDNPPVKGFTTKDKFVEVAP